MLIGFPRPNFLSVLVVMFSGLALCRVFVSSRLRVTLSVRLRVTPTG